MKLNGYRATHRNKWRLIQHNILSIQELALLEFYVDIADFDKDHSNFSLFKTDFSNFSAIFNCKSENTIRNWHNRLLELGFIQRTEKCREYKVAYFDRYLSPGKWGGKAAQYAEQEKDQSIEVILQNFGIKPQPIEEKFQLVGEQSKTITEKPPSIAVSSSKVQSYDYPTRVSMEQKVRSGEAYQRIYKEGKFGGLTPDEMRWIDENIKEVREVKDEATEKDVIEIFFSGNLDSYKRHLITG